MDDIKLGLIVVGGIVAVVVISGAAVCVALKPDVAKEIILGAFTVAGTAVSGIIGWMARGAYDAARQGPKAPINAEDIQVDDPQRVAA